MSLPIISVEQMREWEKTTWATGRTEKEVIGRVGKIVAERSMHLTRPGDVILILCGKGHNGDDARATLAYFRERKVISHDVVEPQVALRKFFTASSDTPKPKLILDGLFGIGLSRSMDKDWQKLIAAVNESNIPVLAVDVPSGIDADTGEIRGAAIQATITLTLAAPKRGLLSPTAIPFVNRLEVAPEIGLVPCPFSNDLNWTCEEDFQNFPPVRHISSHKGSFGHVAIVAGSLGYHGAAVLAARGALRARPGLISVFAQQNIYLPVASQLQAAMVHPWISARDFPETCSAILFGPGLAATELSVTLKKEMIKVWEQSLLPIIADASALDWLPAVRDFPNALRVITPHPGEAARMLHTSIDAVQADRVAALRKLSVRYGNCLVVLKGHQTLVGRSHGEVFINSTGNPFLAQGGSGDVLAGYISGLLAQPTLLTDPLKTIRYAVWQHGAAADQLTAVKSNWTVDELLQVLGEKIFTANEH